MHMHIYMYMYSICICVQYLCIIYDVYVYVHVCVCICMICIMYMISLYVFHYVISDAADTVKRTLDQVGWPMSTTSRQSSGPLKEEIPVRGLSTSRARSLGGPCHTQ